MPSFIIILASVRSYIVDGACVPWGAGSSSLDGFVDTMVASITYLIPLALMIFCYSRIVYALCTKVKAYHYLRQGGYVFARVCLSGVSAR